MAVLVSRCEETSKAERVRKSPYRDKQKEKAPNEMNVRWAKLKIIEWGTKLEMGWLEAGLGVNMQVISSVGLAAILVRRV